MTSDKWVGRQSRQLKRQTERLEPTVEQLATRYVEEYAKAKKRSWRDDACILNSRVLPAWGNLKAKSIQRADVHQLVSQIATKERKPVRANRVLASIRKMFSFALDAGVIHQHPCLRMAAPGEERTRERTLRNDEIKAFWRGAEQYLPRKDAVALRLQLLLGCRIGELLKAEWVHFDLPATTISFWSESRSA